MEHPRYIEQWRERVDTSGRRFADYLSGEVLRSERLRSGILAAVFGFGCVYSVALVMLTDLGDVPQYRENNHIIVLATAGVALYELLMLRLITGAIAAGRLVGRPVWYVNTLIEVSVPTVIIVFLRGAFSHPVYALAGPALLMYFAFIILSTFRLEFKMGVYTGAVAAAQYAAVVFYSFAEDPPLAGVEPFFAQRPFHLVKAVMLLFGGVMAGFVAREIRRRTLDSYVMLEERTQILNVFGQQTAPAIVDELLKHGADTSGRRLDVCIMFLDIRGYTAFAEKHSPEQVVAYLNRLFDYMIEIVHEHHGIIPQLLGDGFMAIFGAPISHGNDTQNATNAARAILGRTEREMRESDLPETHLGIGLHAGEGLVGTVGSTIHKEYKVTGDVVNLASRIEQLNKEFGSSLLISATVLDQIDATESPVLDSHTVEVRGRAAPVTVHRLV
ncbi:adenylate/guanylate cyclase domain-containing protein [Candidatus Poribacteria bacterium]|nr:adenylate/guanylate cyclase domain-containing protein [Candidatus Poribacteria bacterium]MBT5535751.1 adenylate/guanylate cyclase domain-containing protein [Candidatus Poribacteria bacterium]MBT5710263.1 adenylate/guanylate cyclase domain-containing protein [Candidatus Poribacteria bacterium]MBT7807282.1 adenylate/guanylate cyclase domain-containing protein [Candidatus Poribacteria bacterium]